MGDSAKLRKRESKIMGRLWVYPCILIVCQALFGMINRVQNVVSPENPIFVLYILHRFFSSVTGFVNCIVYGLNKNVRQQVATRCCAWRQRRGIDALPHVDALE